MSRYERGQGLVEWALILVLIAVVIIVILALFTIQPREQQMMDAIDTCIERETYTRAECIEIVTAAYTRRGSTILTVPAGSAP